MKLTTFLLLIALMQVSAAGFGQKVTLKANGITMNNIFNQIRKQTGFSVLVDGSDFSTNRKIDVSFSEAPLKIVLDELLKDTGFGYEIENKNILVERKEKTPIDQIAGRFQAIDVTGKVVDTDGRPLPGSSVTIKGTKISTTTDNDGTFLLRHVQDDAMLIITYIGFEPREVKAEKSLGTIRMKASLNPLDEVQVIAYGTTTRRLSTGNIGTLRAKDIENQPVTNPLLALQGRVPGLVITQNTGVPGGGVSVRIQGQNSFRSGNNPLYIVDGVPIESSLPRLNGVLLGNSGVDYEGQVMNEGSPLSYLNPTDIESIDVLKDADATSIYGSKAANGAILITTKKGKIGSMQLDANLNLGWGKAVFNNFNMLNTRQYLDMRYEAFNNDGIDWRNPAVVAPDLKLWDTTRYTNWPKMLLGGLAMIQQAQVSISGGTIGLQYRLSGSYNRSSSVFPDNGNGNPIGSFSANINSLSANRRLRMSWSMSYQYNHNEMPSNNFITTAWLLPPNAPEPFSVDGTLNWSPDVNGNSTYLSNPYRGMSQVFTNTTSNLISSLNLGFKVKNFEITSSLGYNNLTTDDFSPEPSSVIQPELRSSYLNRASYGHRELKSFIFEPQLNYQEDTNFGKLNFLIGATFRNNNSYSQNLQGINYPSDALLGNIGSASSINTDNGGSLTTQYKYLAYFGRFNYNLKDEYVANFSIRRDGSSRFGQNRRFANFWSIGGAWIFSNNFLVKSTIPWLDFGKLRASYGLTGNDQIGDFRFIRTYSPYPLQIPYQGISSLQALSLPNPDLAWEEVKKLSVGLDFGIAKDRILFGLGYSQNVSDNQLAIYPLSTVTGATSMNRNLNARFKNLTWEFNINTTNIKNTHLQWSTNFNISFAKNLLVSFPNLEKSPYASQLVIGQPIDLIRVYRYAGVNSSTGEYQYLDKNSNPVSPNFISVEDLVSRSFSPPLYGGFQNNLKWNNFILDVFFQFTKQWKSNVDYYNGYSGITPGVFDLASSAGNQPISVLNRWKHPGDKTEIAKFSSVLFNGTESISGSDAFLKDASFVRLKNVSLTWQVPVNWLSRTGVRSASISLSGQNLITITNYNGPDPETDGLQALPPLRVFTAGIRLGL